MGELRDYIEQRRQSLQARYDELEAELAPIRSELSDIQRAQEAIVGRQGRAMRPLSIQGMILEVVQASAVPMRATGIMAAIQDRYARDVARESLAPQISRLCQAGKLTNDHGCYSPSPTSPVAKDERHGEG